MKFSEFDKLQSILKSFADSFTKDISFKTAKQNYANQISD